MASELAFDEWLADLRYGRASEEWAEAMAEVVKAVRDTGKAGSLTIVLDIEPGGRTVKITDRLKQKVPQFDREKSIYFADGAGGLHRDDPTQVRAEADPENNLTLVTPPAPDGKSAAAGRD